MTNNNPKILNLNNSLPLYLLTGFLIAVLTSCAKRDPGTEVNVNLSKEAKLSAMKMLENTRQITLFEAPEGIIFVHVTKIVAFDDYFVSLIDIGHPALFVHNRRGEFLHKIGRQGRGPGEYINLNDFTITPRGTILALYANRIMLEFGLDGTLLNEKRLEYGCVSFEVDNEGNWYLYLSYNSGSDPNRLFVLDKNLYVTNRFFNEPNQLFPFQGTNFVRDNGSVFFREPFSNTAYKLSGGEIRPYITYDWGIHSFDPEMFSLDAMKILQHVNEGKFYTFRSFINRGDFSYASFSDGANNLFIHVVHNKMNDSLRVFVSDPVIERLTDALQINSEGELVFALPGSSLNSLVAENPGVLEKLQPTQFDENAHYLLHLCPWE